MYGEKENAGREETGGGEELETSMLSLARLDAWIMTVLKCLGSEEDRGGNRQRTYGETFMEFLPMAMEQIIASLYQFVEVWEPDDLKI